MGKILMSVATAFLIVSLVTSQVQAQSYGSQGSVTGSQYAVDPGPDLEQSQKPEIYSGSGAGGEIPFEFRPGYTCYPDTGPPNPIFGCNPDAYEKDLADDGELSRSYTIYLVDERGNVVEEEVKSLTGSEECYTDPALAESWDVPTCADVGIEAPEDNYLCQKDQSKDFKRNYGGPEDKWVCSPVSSPATELECVSLREVQPFGPGGGTRLIGRTTPYTIYTYDMDGNLVDSYQRSVPCSDDNFLPKGSGGGTDASEEAAQDVEPAVQSVENSRQDGNALPDGSGDRAPGEPGPESGESGALTIPGPQEPRTTGDADQSPANEESQEASMPASGQLDGPVDGTGEDTSANNSGGSNKSDSADDNPVPKEVAQNPESEDEQEATRSGGEPTVQTKGDATQESGGKGPGMDSSAGESTGPGPDQDTDAANDPASDVGEQEFARSPKGEGERDIVQSRENEGEPESARSDGEEASEIEGDTNVGPAGESPESVSSAGEFAGPENEVASQRAGKTGAERVAQASASMQDSGAASGEVGGESEPGDAENGNESNGSTELSGGKEGARGNEAAATNDYTLLPDSGGVPPGWIVLAGVLLTVGGVIGIRVIRAR